MNRRNILLALGLVLALVVVNTGISRREALLRNGDTVLLGLAPVDPRSLLQGDYMALDFAIAADVRAVLHETTIARGHADGYAVLARAVDGTTRFVRAQATVTPVSGEEIALRYRLRGGQVRIVTNAWFFAEGQGERYAVARYGELRVGDDGEALLVALRDEALKPL